MSKIEPIATSFYTILIIILLAPILVMVFASYTIKSYTDKMLLTEIWSIVLLMVYQYYIIVSGVSYFQLQLIFIPLLTLLINICVVLYYKNTRGSNLYKLDFYPIYCYMVCVLVMDIYKIYSIYLYFKMVEKFS